jgi:hypothetical protein
MYGAKTTFSQESQYGVTIRGQMVVGKYALTSSGKVQLTWDGNQAVYTRSVKLVE